MYGCSCRRSKTGSPIARIGATAASASAEVAAVADAIAQIRSPCHSGGHERRGRRAEQDQARGQLARRLGRDRPVRAQELLGPFERPCDEAAEHGRADLVQAERERGDDAEVGAGPANGPEQVFVLVAARAPDAAVGGDDLDLEQVVDRPAEAAREVAEAAAEGETGHADLGEEAERGGEAVTLGRAVDVARGGSRAGRWRSGRRDRPRPRAAATCRSSRRRRRAPCRRCCGRRRAPRAARP